MLLNCVYTLTPQHPKVFLVSNFQRICHKEQRCSPTVQVIKAQSPIASYDDKKRSVTSAKQLLLPSGPQSAHRDGA